MAESRPDSFSGKNVKVPSEEHGHHHHKETHGLREDIDVNTPLSCVKAPSVFERAKEEFEAVFLRNEEHRHHHHKESHGLREDIDVNTPLSDVKAPSVFERAKEEIEALVEAIHPKKESESHDLGLYGDSAGKDGLKYEKSEGHSEKNFKAPNLIEKAKEEIETLMHKPHHHKETHGLSNDINENTPTSQVKGPNVFERAKEEIEAFIRTVHPKKGSD